MSFLRELQRALYLSQRSTGDIRAAQHGRLGKRLLRRTVTRSLLRPYGKLWR